MSQGSAGPVPSPTHWARIQLVQGTSEAGLFDLTSQMPEARVPVGSAPSSRWMVNGPTVAPLHFEFFWDGKGLWVSPPTGPDLTVDGERVQAWRQLVGRSRIEFGGAAMLVETSSAVALPPSVQQSIQPAAQDGRIGFSSEFDDEDATAIFDEGLPPLEEDSTMMVDAGSVPRPGFGGSPSFGGPVAAFGDMTPSLEELPSATPFGDSPGHTQIFDPEAAGIQLGSVPPPPPSGAPRPLSSSALSTDVLPGRGGDSRFAAPPPISLDSQGPRKLELPPRRTLVLAGLTLLAALLLLGQSFLNKAREAEALEAERRSALAEVEARAEEAATAAEAAADSVRTARLDMERGLLESAEAEATVPRDNARDAALDAMDPDFSEDQVQSRLEDAGRFAVERMAARAMINNDHRRALGFYLYLARDYPEISEYPRIADILRSKVP